MINGFPIHLLGFAWLSVRTAHPIGCARKKRIAQYVGKCNTYSEVRYIATKNYTVLLRCFIDSI